MLGLKDSVLHHQLCDALYLLWVIQYPKALVMNYNVLVQHHTLADTNFPFFLVLRQDMVLSSCYGRRLYARTAPPPRTLDRQILARGDVEDKVQVLPLFTCI